MKPLGLWEYFLMLATVASLFLALHFALQARALRAEVAGMLFSEPVVIEHSGRGEEIVIFSKGEVVGEWEPRDGEVYDVLDEALHE